MQQPYLNTRSAVVAAPLQAWSALDGQADGLAPQRTVEGAYCGDVRILSRMLLSSTSHELEHVATSEPGGGRANYQYVVRTPELGVDPALVLERIREVSPTGVGERYAFTTAALSDQLVELEVRLRPDATTMADIKSGVLGPAVAPVAATAGAARWGWRDERTVAVLATDGELLADGADQLLRWQVHIPARGVATVGWTLSAHDRGAGFVGCTAAPLLPPVTGRARLDRLLEASFSDINGLRLALPEHTDEAFLAAGAPWYFTLFGRDSLIAARNLLGHDLTIPLGTLRTLAGLQGSRTDADSAEQPGKILHEVRQEPLELELSHQLQRENHMSLPPLYYGTIDATCLWVMLLDEAERAGLGEHQVRELLPNLRRALAWIEDSGDADGDGFLEYIDLTGHGLANQGWKDSGDSVRFADGRLASGTVALAEVQGYAHAAALGGARLLARYEGDTGAAEHWTSWADAMATRFREHFWASDSRGRYPVLALSSEGVEGAKTQVDGVASNMGHLLGTGILTDSEAELVVARLMDPTMFSGYGIRTLSEDNGGYWPMGYHVGSVWTHDTAFIVDQMLRDGFTEQARELAGGLLRAAEGFGNRLPELFGGLSRELLFPPQPYPASCRPQAWAATASVVIARALA